MGKFVDLTGQRFGSLIVIERAENTKNNKAQWLCRCDCGNLTVVQRANLKSGGTVSCGCKRKPHGKVHSRLYNIWRGIKQRCSNPNATGYKNYGGRGVAVCDEWLHNFQAFYDWSMQNGYAENLTIDRVNTDENYSPDNCRWVTQKVQQNNKRTNHYITFNGETHTIREWEDKLNLKRGVVDSRLRRGKTIEEALGKEIAK